MNTSIESTANKVSPKQVLGVFFIALSLFTYFGGLSFVYSASSLGCSLRVNVKDSQTGDPIQGAKVVLKGMDYQDLAYVSLNMDIGPTDSDGECGAGTSMWGTFYFEASKEGYESDTGSASAGTGGTASTTIRLDPVSEETSDTPEEPTDPEEPTEPMDPEDEEPSDPINEDPSDPSTPEEPVDIIPDGEPLTVINDNQMNPWETMVTRLCAILGIGCIVLDLEERH